MDKLISITDLVKDKGVQESYLRELAHRDIYTEIGWRNDKKRSKIYFYENKLEAYMQQDMNVRCPG